MTFPGVETPQSVAYWQDAKGSWRFDWSDQFDGSPAPPQAVLAELINELHYTLGLPIACAYLMAIVSLLYGLALLSGLVIHLPRLAGDLFALRRGRNLKQMWQDAHAALVTALIPLVHGAFTGVWLWTSATNGYWPLFWIDGIALAMAFGFAAMAHASGHRARHGDPHSVWADAR